MFIFCFLGVGLPWCSIFCQFWLCEEAQCVYLRRHLGSLFPEFFTIAENIRSMEHGSQKLVEGLRNVVGGHLLVPSCFVFLFLPLSSDATE